MVRALEPPNEDEGFDAVETIAFQRLTPRGERTPSLTIALENMGDSSVVTAALERLPPNAPVLVIAWKPGADDAWRAQTRSRVDDLARAIDRSVDLAICAHPGGPPTCWCRPPLPGLWIDFAERRGVQREGSILVGASSAHAQMARALGLQLFGASPTNRVVG
jgi:hypothetical protein